MMLSKGLKRKREEEQEKETLAVDTWWLDPSLPAVAQPPPPATSSSLFDLSVLKLHHSLRQSEPDLRHLVLVVNTLRRVQASMAPEPTLPPVPSPSAAPCVADSLLASSDAALSASMASLLEDLSHIEGLSQAPQPLVDEGPPGRPTGGSPPSLGALDLLGPATGCLLDDELEGLFEDIDTSMYDSELWAPASEALKPGPEDGPGKEEALELDEAELDYLLDVLVGTQALERPPGPGR
ncbi:SERTA domain-containing protein 1 [Mustela lutreola]|uniref:SERTA domain-containing protein 1 n=1 Tax=Mustela lutreola TaxID=9666 RepID=UPI00279798C7|nr:SERTA domain-containing protein 1 [Mustela lutreola]XP_059008858.1 SERTA domain-containing protein 1 [Mustela lutreola]XP_059008859.1 SERTA domain-containing protein 1 [Mustela lutreola]XP_059008860.1 SERTA domain-containing protein 1 [Mustela lutreola]